MSYDYIDDSTEETVSYENCASIISKADKKNKFLLIGWCAEFL